MANLENRIGKLEEGSGGKPEIWVQVIYSPGEDLSIKKLLALSAYNAENGTDYAETDVSWVLVEIVDGKPKTP